MPPSVTRLYDSVVPSGNGYKVRLLLHQRGLDVEIVELDFMVDPPETRLPAFLSINPNGRIPAIELEDGRVLWESGAILFFLAKGSPYLPDDPYLQARVLQWMFFEQYSHEPYIAVYKFWKCWGGLDKLRPEEQQKLLRRGHEALGVMNSALEQTPFIAGERYTIADIALFAYTQSAARVGFDLGPTPFIEPWLERVRAQPGYIPIKTSEVYPELG